MSRADNNLRRSVTCCGHARLEEMSGLCSREEHKNAVMKLVIFFPLLQADAIEVEQSGT